MTETLLRDRVEIERQRIREADLNRFGSIESALAVLQTKFDALLVRAVDGDDLKELRRELEEEMNNTIKSANEQQAKDIIGEVRGMLADQRNAQAEDQKHLRRQVALMVFGSALSLLGALAFFWMTRNG